MEAKTMRIRSYLLTVTFQHAHFRDCRFIVDLHIGIRTHVFGKEDVIHTKTSIYLSVSQYSKLSW